MALRLPRLDDPSGRPEKRKNQVCYDSIFS